MAASTSKASTSAEAAAVSDASEKFANLFDFRDNWIVTRNDAMGQQRAALFGNDGYMAGGTGEWLPVENKGAKKKSLADVFVCPKLFIADLLRADWKGNHFLFKNLKFKRVFICGTVISTHRSTEKHVIIVDDGTSNISCYLPECTDFQTDLRKEVALQKKETTELLSRNTKDPAYKAAYVMARNAMELLQLAPSTIDEFDLGDTVSFSGNIKEYSENRYVFINKIKKLKNGSGYFQQYLKDLFYLYEEVYK